MNSCVRVDWASGRSSMSLGKYKRHEGKAHVDCRKNRDVRGGGKRVHQCIPIPVSSPYGIPNDVGMLTNLASCNPISVNCIPFRSFLRTVAVLQQVSIGQNGSKLRQ